MLSVYTNRQDLLKTTSKVKGSRFEIVDKELLNLETKNYAVTFKNATTRANLELHVYTPDGAYLTGNHKTNYSNETNDTTSNKIVPQHVSINFQEELTALNITRGQFKVAINVFDNLLGSYDGLKLWIKEISPSRREIRLQLSDSKSPVFYQQLLDFRDRWEGLELNNVFDSFVLNFGSNETFQIINAYFDIDETDTPELVVRLYSPLSSKFGEKSKLWISEELIEPVIDTVVIIPKHIPAPSNNLSGPNFELDEFDGSSIATDFKSWNDLLSTNILTSQQIIDAQFSGSLSGVKLNIDYRIFDNFIHFGSAVERVENFKYKLSLIEQYSNQISTVSSVIGGAIVQTNLLDLNTKRNRVVSGFDDFEKYLFFESSGSKLYTHYEPISGSNTISPVNPWPKTISTELTWTEAFQLWSTAAAQWSSYNATNTTDPYGYFSIQAGVESNAGIAYFDSLLEIADTYDRRNMHKLQNAVPMHIQSMTDNDEFILFIHMLGQHFDILWTYINNLTSTQTREEHPKDGMPNDLLYHVASSLGFKLYNGKSNSELWKYTLGTDEYNNKIQSDNNGITSLPDSDITKELWRRIVNNIPYILKTKGTARAVKALISCFGIPSTLLTIKEYGGPSTFTDNDHYPEYIHEVFHYAWFSNTPTGSLLLPVSQYYNGDNILVRPNTLEFRFKPDNNFTYNLSNEYNILSIDSGSVGDVYNLILRKDSNDDNEGSLILFNRITGTAISASNLEIFDNSWHSVFIECTHDYTSSLNVAKSLYGKLIYNKSSSYIGSDLLFFPESGSTNLTLASGSRNIPTASLTLLNTEVTKLDKFYGHFQELRLWSGTFLDEVIKEHTLSPNTYTFNVDRDATSTGAESEKPYIHMFQRYPLSTKKLYSGSIYQPSVHPRQTRNTGSLYYVGYADSGSITFESFEETYYTPSPSLGGQSLYANKIRIESSSVRPNARLNTKTRVEKSSFDRYSVDSNRLGVYFSPQVSINEDIMNQLGYYEIDDYIGDPGDLYSNTYPKMDQFAINYWKKYENRNDFEQYFRALEIYDFTLFRYIKDTLPARTNSILGLVVEPNILERHRVRILRNKPGIENLTRTAELDVTYLRPTADTVPLIGIIKEPVPPPTAVTTPIKGVIEEVMPPLSAITTPIKGVIEDAMPPIKGDIKSIKGVIAETIPPLAGDTDIIKGVIEDVTIPIQGDTSIIKGSIQGISLPIEGDTSIIKGAIEEPAPKVDSMFTIMPVGGIDPPELHSTAVVDSAKATVIKYELKDPTITVSNPAPGVITSKAIEMQSSYYAVGATIADSIRVDRLGNDWSTNRYIGKYKIRESGSFTPVQTIVLDSKPSSHLRTPVFYFSSPASASRQEYSSFELVPARSNPTNDSTGYQNLKFNGSKLTGPGINIDTPNTVDGGPVVKVTKVNPNKLVFSNGKLTTIDESRTGNRKKSI